MAHDIVRIASVPTHAMIKGHRAGGECSCRNRGSAYSEVTLANREQLKYVRQSTNLRSRKYVQVEGP